MNTGEYYNWPVADWARQNIRGTVKIRRQFSSRAGVIFTYSLLYCVPAAFLLTGVVMFALDPKKPSNLYAPFFFAFLIAIPCTVIALLGAYVRRGLAVSLDPEGVTGSFVGKFLWGKLYYVDHVSKYVRAGSVSRRVKDNQLELIFEGGKVIIPPLIHERAMIWGLINSMPCEVRDDGVPRTALAPSGGVGQGKAAEVLMDFLNSIDRQRGQGE